MNEALARALIGPLSRVGRSSGGGAGAGRPWPRPRRAGAVCAREAWRAAAPPTDCSPAGTASAAPAPASPCPRVPVSPRPRVSPDRTRPGRAGLGREAFAEGRRRGLRQLRSSARSGGRFPPSSPAPRALSPPALVWASRAKRPASCGLGRRGGPLLWEAACPGPPAPETWVPPQPQPPPLAGPPGSRVLGGALPRASASSGRPGRIPLPRAAPTPAAPSRSTLSRASRPPVVGVPRSPHEAEGSLPGLFISSHSCSILHFRTQEKNHLCSSCGSAKHVGGTLKAPRQRPPLTSFPSTACLFNG